MYVRIYTLYVCSVVRRDRGIRCIVPTSHVISILENHGDESLTLESVQDDKAHKVFLCSTKFTSPDDLPANCITWARECKFPIVTVRTQVTYDDFSSCEQSLLGDRLRPLSHIPVHIAHMARAWMFSICTKLNLLQLKF